MTDQHEQEATVAVPAAALDALMRAWVDNQKGAGGGRGAWLDAVWQARALHFCHAVQPTWVPQPAETEEER